ncbi:MAG: glycine radical domain-containing protein [Thermodesulfobacteriota bacterium]|nr:glycine radical domain-containing protein [Thermodesulfobacteriota bacterium]
MYHVQFNCVGDRTLLEAPAQPDKHTDSVVRVGGYSAYFVNLSKGVQDEIVARVGMGL